MKTQAIPYLCVKDAGRALEFYQAAFGFTEVLRLTEPGGRIAHAEVKLGDALVMISEEYPELGILGPQSRGGATGSVVLYVDDADAVAARAVAAGAKLVNPVKDEFYGDRTGKLEDPFGHVWHVSTVKEEMSPEEMQKRFTALFKTAG